jgi:hypothetical protein
MNYNDIMKEKAKNFYDYILSIVPPEKHNTIAPYEKIIDNIYLIFLFINRQNIDNEVIKLKRFYSIEDLTIEQENKLKDYINFFLDVKDKLFTKNQEEKD